MAIPPELSGQKYIALVTFRRDGTGVRTPVWFAEKDGKLYVSTRNDSWKYRRIGNNPQVELSSCTVRGKITGPWFQGRARILPPVEWADARRALKQKYWLSRLVVWSNKKNEYLEIEVIS